MIGCASSPKTPGLAIEVDITNNDGLPEGSPFTRWEDARKFSGPLPFTFTCEAEKKRVLIVEGVRSDWKPVPVRVLRHAHSVSIRTRAW